ncbi:hypothetical protein [Muricoccus pecuniae]|uniref:DUF4412 domain-containing protein n=1 Tax=Muricoccus pecuniae TaxID=693023 RepID=A0A840YL38_9PROT|nr:hypothetical protein [Roseomonas pecuniae]MBB5695024.1 hypothetical protein [Roseomonas pecuniae]
MLRALLSLVLLAPAAAFAQSAPPPMPTRDVAVTYRTSEGGEMRFFWRAADSTMRAEGMGDAGGAMIYDMRGRNIIMLMDAQRAYVRLPGDDDDRKREVGSLALGDVKPGDKVSREGAAEIAGQRCTVWRVERAKESPEDEAEVERSCVTADGVLLRRVEGEGDEAETSYLATRVAYGPQDPALFRAPAGWRQMSLDELAKQIGEGLRQR